MNVRHSILSVVAVVAMIALAFAATPAQAAPSNPFAGEWSGNFYGPGVEGTVDWTISPSGVITGTFYNTTLDIGGTMVGHVDKDGNLHLNPNIYGPGPGGEGGNGEHHAGTATINEDGQLVGETVGVWHGGYAVTAILDPV
jgi:hypothetical protein